MEERENLVVDKWLALHAASRGCPIPLIASSRPDGARIVQTCRNPNRVRALIGDLRPRQFP